MKIPFYEVMVEVTHNSNIVAYEALVVLKDYPILMILGKHPTIDTWIITQLWDLKIYEKFEKDTF